MNRTKKTSHLYAEVFNRPDHQRRTRQRQINFERSRGKPRGHGVVLSRPPAPKPEPLPTQAMVNPPRPKKLKRMVDRVFRRQAR